MAFSTEKVALAVDGLLRIPVAELEEAQRTVEVYMQAVLEQLSECRAQVKDLSHTISVDCVDSIDVLAERAEALEVVFTKIDRLQSEMDRVHSLVLALNKTVKAIEAPADVKERAANFFKSFGLGKGLKVIDDNASGKTAWNRVPQHMMIEGAVPSEFSQRIRDVVGSLAVCTSS